MLPLPLSLPLILCLRHSDDIALITLLLITPLFRHIERIVTIAGHYDTR